eukprot:TRINITY_DN48753_c0_g1_i1.p1 TRINITY_DN48753_c0_g1~~TRINITY_DN48753_c0_g1_i1.p1  ORF type:complete len:715 (+),score=69.91 TRINITY_DN48753_c0_g1_i1:46-2145(+)
MSATRKPTCKPCKKLRGQAKQSGSCHKRASATKRSKKGSAPGPNGKPASRTKIAPASQPSRKKRGGSQTAKVGTAKAVAKATVRQGAKRKMDSQSARSGDDASRQQQNDSAPKEADEQPATSSTDGWKNGWKDGWKDDWKNGRNDYGNAGWADYKDSWNKTSSWNSWNNDSWQSPGWHDDTEVCAYYLKGKCEAGKRCKRKHCWTAWESGRVWPYPVCRREDDSEPMTTTTSVKFVVHAPQHCSKQGAKNIAVRRDDPSEEAVRLRIVGSLFALGSRDAMKGADMLWIGDRWESLALPARCREAFSFAVVQLVQPVSHPGLMQGSERTKAHAQRRFVWAEEVAARTPGCGQVLIVQLKLHCGAFGPSPEPSSERCEVHTQVVPRREAIAFGVRGYPLEHFLVTGGQRCLTFDSPSGVTMDFCVYLPPGYKDNAPAKGWPLLFFLHAMHCHLDRDNSLFYESDAPLQLLLDSDGKRCPQALREKFVVLSPHCPVDVERGDGTGVWLRAGWYEDSRYVPEVEVALACLLENVSRGLKIDRQKIMISGSSMGAYAALELPSRWPGVFAASAPVAAHYDLDPVHRLIDRLASGESLPFWFFHARNDVLCEFPVIQDLVKQLRKRTKAEVRLTAYVDTWSNSGHCSDRVAYWSGQSPDELMFGDELFEWLLKQQSEGTASVMKCLGDLIPPRCLGLNVAGEESP